MDEKNVIVCRCEEVRLADITDMINRYHCSPREVKLRTRAGMGFCGGRICRELINRIVSGTDHTQLSDDIPLSYRPPIRPIAFKRLGEMEQ